MRLLYASLMALLLVSGCDAVKRVEPLTQEQKASRIAQFVENRNFMGIFENAYALDASEIRTSRDVSDAVSAYFEAHGKSWHEIDAILRQNGFDIVPVAPKQGYTKAYVAQKERLVSYHVVGYIKRVYRVSVYLRGEDIAQVSAVTFRDGF